MIGNPPGSLYFCSIIKQGKMKRINVLFVAGCALLLTGLLSCSKEKKDETEKNTPTIEKQHEDTGDDFNNNSESENEQKLEEIEVIQNRNETDLAIKELRRCVTIHRDLVKKYKATGKVEYKNQALSVESKAKKIQEKLKGAKYQPHSPQIKETGDLFTELEESMLDLAN